MKSLKFALILVLIICLYYSSNAAVYDKNGNKVPDLEAPTKKINWQLLTAERGAEFRGIQMVSTFAKACSSALIDTGRSDDQKAYVLTAGHCSHVKEMQATEVFVDVTTDVSFTVNFYFDSPGSDLFSFKGRRLVYLTQHTADLGIYELDVTIGELKSRGFTFYGLSKFPPDIGTEVFNVGLPMNYMSNEVDGNQAWLHYSECKTGELVALKEHRFDWNHSFRHNCSGVGGMSGSPLISKKTNEIVGVFNTVVGDETIGMPDCSDSRPCEVQGDVIQVFPEHNYAQRVDIMAQCFNNEGDFDLNLESCKLPKP
jgi:hypothetical protein